MPIAQSSSKHQTENKFQKRTQRVTECESEHKPEVVTTTGTKTPPEQPEFIKQTLIIIEKKVRNLDKRRQKLEEYKEVQRKGTVLNEDQLSAVSRYDEVIRTLELSRELEKSFVGLANDTMKQQKKQLKRDQMEREEALKEKLKEAHKYFSILSKFGDETVRNDFLNETNGAIKITQQELEFLDEFDKIVSPCEPGTKLDSTSVDFADHLSALIEGKNKPITIFKNAITYSEMKKLFERLITAPYWTVEVPKPEETVTETEPEVTEEAVAPETTEEKPVEALNQAVDNLQLNEQKETLQNEQAIYQNQHVDDFVIVSSSECAESLCHSKSASVEPQSQSELSQEMSQSQNKTFFTTLNQPTEQRQNINEFINSCENNGEGLNFFQDSELTPRQQEQLQQQQQQQQNEMNMQNQGQQHHENFNQHPNDMQKDQGYKHRGPRDNGNRPYQQRRNPDDRRNGNNHMQQQPRNNDNRGPRNNNGYRGGASGNGQRGGYRGQNEGGYRGNGRQNNNGPRGNYQQQQQQPRGNYNQDMHHEQHSQMA